MSSTNHMKGGEGEDSGMRQPVGGKKGKKRQNQNDHQDGGNPLKTGGEGEVPKVGGSGDKYMSGGADAMCGVRLATADEIAASKCDDASEFKPAQAGGRRRRRKSRKARKSRKSRKGRKSRKH